MSNNLCAIIQYEGRASRVTLERAMRDIRMNLTGNLDSRIVTEDASDPDVLSFRVAYGVMYAYVHDGHIILDTLRHWGTLYEMGKEVVAGAIFDIANSLGAKEAWYFEDECDLCSASMSFDDLKRALISSLGTPWEFEGPSSSMGKLFLHDSFARFQNELTRRRNFGSVALVPFAEGYQIIKTESGLAIRRECGLMHISDYKFDLNGDEITVFRGDECAVLDCCGEPLTDFVTGDFLWKYGETSADRNIVCAEHGIVIKRFMNKS